MQLLCAIHGGRLHQHLPEVTGHDEHRTPGGYAWHDVELDPGSLAERAAGGPRAHVASHHHQGVADPGRLKVTGRAATDGTIEAVEDPAAEYLLGVLWHPEEDDGAKVVPSLVEAARRG
jgi:putative glutamine amidotransferase